jgi:hypothetical protein
MRPWSPLIKKDYVYLKNNSHIYGFLVSRGNHYSTHGSYVIDFWCMSYVDNKGCGPCYLRRSGRGNLFPCHSKFSRLLSRARQV